MSVFGSVFGAGSNARTINPGGWGFYADSATTQGDAQVVTNSASVFTTLPNDSDFVVEELPYDTETSLWNSSTSLILPYNLHDTFHLRLKMTVENYSGSAPYLELCLNGGGATGMFECQSQVLVKGGNPQTVELKGGVFVGSDFLANGGLFQMRYDGNGSIDVYNKTYFIERIYKNVP
jgi:hypothetical protein